MSFSMADFLETYRKEDITKEKEILKNKWTKTLAVIKEAFSDHLVNKTEAIRVVKSEFTKGECSDKIDVKFLNENLDYVVGKIQELNEGTVKIIIQNSEKECKRRSKDIEVSEIDEAKKAKKSKKAKKEDDDADDLPANTEDEVIVDEPSASDALEISTAEAPEQPEVTISYNADENKLEVKEGEEVIEELEVEDKEALAQVVGFLKDFYSKHDYLVNEEGLEDIEGTEEHSASETSSEESKEDDETVDELVGELPVDESVKLTESRISFIDLIEQYDSTVEKLTEEDKPTAQSLVGKAVMIKDGTWLTCKESTDDGKMTCMDKDGMDRQININDVEDYEKDVLPKKSEVKESAEVVAEATSPEATRLANSWRKSPTKGTKGALPSAIDKKKDVKSQSISKTPMKKTGQVLSKVKIPKITKKGESTGSFTKKSGMKTMSKVPSTNKIPTPKKDAPTGSFSKSPMKVSGKVPSVTAPKMVKKDVSGSGYSKTPKKPDCKKETVKAPKLK